MVVMIGKNCFSLIAKVHEELNVPGCPEHGAGVELMGISRRSLDFRDQGLPHSLPLVCGTYGKQANHAHASYRPKSHGADNGASFFRNENVFFPRVLFQALESFCGPPAHLVDAGIFAEGGLLHVKKSGKINFSRHSNVNHHMHPEEEAVSALHSESNRNWQGIGLVLGNW